MQAHSNVFFGAAVVLAVGCVIGTWHQVEALKASTRRLAHERSLEQQQQPARASPALLASVEQASLPQPSPVAVEPVAPAAPQRIAPPPRKRVPPAMALRGQVRDEVIPAVEVPTPVEEVHAQDAMRMALRHKRAFLERCFDQELKKRAIFNGFVVLKVSVAVDGKVTDTQVLEGNSRDRAVGHCMAAHLRTVRLPALSAEADLILPIRLEAKAPNWAEARASLD